MRGALLPLEKPLPAESLVCVHHQTGSDQLLYLSCYCCLIEDKFLALQDVFQDL